MLDTTDTLTDMAQRADNPDHKYQVERNGVKDTEYLLAGDTRAILRFLAAFDENDSPESYTNGDGETETLSDSSLENCGRAMRLIAEESDRGSSEHDPARAGARVSPRRERSRTAGGQTSLGGFCVVGCS